MPAPLLTRTRTRTRTRTLPLTRCLRRCYPLVRRGGIVLVEEYYKHGGSRRATDEVLAQHGEGRRANPAAAAAAAAVSTYAVGEQTRPRFGFSQQGRPTEALSFAQVGQLQALEHGEARHPGSGRAGRPRLGAASRLRTVPFWAPELSL